MKMFYQTADVMFYRAYNKKNDYADFSVREDKICYQNVRNRRCALDVVAVTCFCDKGEIGKVLFSKSCRIVVVVHF